MRSLQITLNTAVVVFMLILCIFVPQYAAASNLEDNVHLQEETSSRNEPSRHAYDGAQATFSALEAAATDSQGPRPWENMAAFVIDLLKITDERLDEVARELRVTKEIAELRSTLHEVIAVSVGMREPMFELVQRGLMLDQISGELEVIFSDILDHLKKGFPPPDQAPSHEYRKEMVTSLLDRAKGGLLEFAHKHGMSEDGQEHLRNSFGQLKPHVVKLAVLIGDLIEQHPILFGTLVPYVEAMVIPEPWVLRPLFNLLGFGPSGLIKGSPAVAAQHLIWGAVVAKASWFATSQRVDMKGSSDSPRIRVVWDTSGSACPAFLPYHSTRE